VRKKGIHTMMAFWDYAWLAIIFAIIACMAYSFFAAIFPAAII